MIRKELLSHKLSFSALIAFLSVMAFLFLASWPDAVYQRYLAFLMSVFYFLWGLLVHFKRKELSNKIALEYLGVSLLAGLILFLITF